MRVWSILCQINIDIYQYSPSIDWYHIDKIFKVSPIPKGHTTRLDCPIYNGVSRQLWHDCNITVIITLSVYTCITCITSILYLVSDYFNMFVQHHLIMATKYLSF